MMKFNIEQLKLAMKQPQSAKTGASFSTPGKIISVSYGKNIVKWFKK